MINLSSHMYNNYRHVPTLFLASLPRSLSSHMYHAIRSALCLAEPLWTTDGEILNADRLALLPHPQEDLGRKFTVQDTPRVFNQMTLFLDEVVQPCGFMYKDVVQPFVFSHWLKSRCFPAIKIKRPLADIVYSMTEKGWYYPARIFPEIQDRTIALAKGLDAASKALDSIIGPTIHFDDFIHDENSVADVLEPLYPNLDRSRLRYIDANFEQMRAEVLARRRTERYESILNLLQLIPIHRQDPRETTKKSPDSSATTPANPPPDYLFAHARSA